MKLLPSILFVGLAAASPALACDGAICAPTFEAGHYDTQAQRNRVSGRWVYENQTVTVPGRWETTFQSVVVPGRYEMRTRTVNVPGRWASELCHSRRGHHRGLTVRFGHGFKINFGRRHRHRHTMVRRWIPPTDSA